MKKTFIVVVMALVIMGGVLDAYSYDIEIINKTDNIYDVRIIVLGVFQTFEEGYKIVDPGKTVVYSTYHTVWGFIPMCPCSVILNNFNARPKKADVKIGDWRSAKCYKTTLTINKDFSISWN